MWRSYALTALYVVTVKIGIVGNLWVICSVLRNTRPRSRSWSRLPSDHLRSYIFVLALVDFAVVCSLILRIVHLWDEQQLFEIWTCRGLYFIEQVLKMASMFCLACISFGRYITIRKPFSNQIRTHFYQSIPVAALLLYFFILIPVLLTVETVGVTVDSRDCCINDSNMWNKLTSIFVGACFFSLLVFVSVNYGEIVRHVRRKFSERRARETANCNNRYRHVSEPQYMREMTSSIMRVAIFHMFCWLPFCSVLLVPTDSCSVVLVSRRSMRTEVKDKQIWVQCVLVLINWLTFLNSALNWIFYAVMNRDLRTLIRTNTERRKRSTMTYYSSFSMPNRNFRQHLGRSLSIIHSYYQDYQDRSGFHCVGHDVSVTQTHAEHSNPKPVYPGLLPPVSTRHLHYVRAPSHRRPAEWSFSISRVPLGDARRSPVVSRLPVFHSYAYAGAKSVIVKVGGGAYNECALEPKDFIDGQQSSIKGSISGNCCYPYNNSASSQNSLLKVEDIPT